MNKQDFLRAFEEILELDPNVLNGNEQLSALSAWDSLAVLGFISFADQKFSLTVKPLDIRDAKTVNDLMGLLGSNITGN